MTGPSLRRGRTGASVQAALGIVLPVQSNSTSSPLDATARDMPEAAPEGEARRRFDAGFGRGGGEEGKSAPPDGWCCQCGRWAAVTGPKRRSGKLS